MELIAPFFEVIHSLVDFVFPPACLICGRTFSEGNLICHDCKHALTINSYRYDPSPRNIKNVKNISVLLPYDNRCRTLIHALKYHGVQSTGLLLGELMGRKAVQQFSPPEDTFLVPVPLHPSRLRERGYNQSERLAQGFSSFTGHSIVENILTRTRETETQTALTPEQRIKNVTGTFQYTGRCALSGRPVILIDDVMTTGSTLSECARALKEGGAGMIFVSVAATPDVGNE